MEFNPAEIAAAMLRRWLARPDVVKKMNADIRGAFIYGDSLGPRQYRKPKKR